MRWFLKEKYLRHCLTGDMENKEAYIKYKNGNGPWSIL